jgi:hypothetical protein
MLSVLTGTNHTSIHKPTDQSLDKLNNPCAKVNKLFMFNSHSFYTEINHSMLSNPKLYLTYKITF